MHIDDFMKERDLTGVGEALIDAAGEGIIDPMTVQTTDLLAQVADINPEDTREIVNAKLNKVMITLELAFEIQSCEGLNELKNNEVWTKIIDINRRINGELSDDTDLSPRDRKFIIESFLMDNISRVQSAMDWVVGESL